MHPRDERALLARAQTSATGWGELFDAYYDRIYAYAYRRVGSRAIAEDIAASVFEDALRGIQRLRWQNKPLVAWLYRIAARRVADHYRARHDELDLDETRIVADSPHAYIERADDCKLVQRGLAKLRASEREIIRLAYFDELSGAEMAAVLNCSTSSVYVRLHRALKKLEKELRDEIG